MPLEITSVEFKKNFSLILRVLNSSMFVSLLNFRRFML